ncbi:glycosyl transferase family 2 [Tenacibaculum sp. E3R01]|uniref:glycosyltransferase family 2 protein n=1 Tax=Tenacibaculum sp. E3R01 TaxID=2267227 RepID=UPI000DE87DF1|nr:glycosyltransferase family 2 protein [Tenacibaculum sp. E3R01]RBW56379.1 glycosyl transferase family 2 [Tenacibaculum sp. E3R01]
MDIALLISTYNWPKALHMVLSTVQNQTVLPNEILIADDGSTEDTKKVIEEWKEKLTIPIKHLWHEDKGFRKTIIMNKAIASSSSNYIVQIDGDILLEKHFIQDHIKNAKKGFFIKGSRALILKDRTESILNNQIFVLKEELKYVKNTINATRMPLFASIFRKDKFKSNNVKGCNFAFWKKDFIAVNGYDNDMDGWGHEDIELAARLTNLGIKQRQLKMVAICFHLHHKFNDRGNENINYSKYLDVVKNGVVRCKNGFN